MLMLFVAGVLAGVWLVFDWCTVDDKVFNSILFLIFITLAFTV